MDLDKIDIEIFKDIKNIFDKNKTEISEISKIVGAKKHLIKNLVTNEHILIIKNLYDNGFGLKRIAKKIKIGYSQLRCLFDICGIEINKGRTVVTDALREFRKVKALKEIANKTGFASEEVKSRIKACKTNRGVGGYYFNESKQKYVWVRSTYEYIFSKWLDKTKHIWDVEVTLYKLPDGTSYRPDFFIYNENGVLIKIIEIKGWYDNRSYKPEMLKEVLGNVEIILICLTNKSISTYTEIGYRKELIHWKANRIIKLD